MTSAHERAAVKAELDRLIDRFFRALSFEPGQQPAIESLPALFIESALLIDNSGPAPDVASVGAFIAARGARVRSGEWTRFRVIERAETTEVFGSVAHRLSACTKSWAQHGADSEQRRIVSTQFVLGPGGWRISAMAWDDERAGHRLDAPSEPTEFGSD